MVSLRLVPGNILRCFRIIGSRISTDMLLFLQLINLRLLLSTYALITCICCIAAEGLDSRREGGSGACGGPPGGPYNTGCSDNEPPKDIDGGLDNLSTRNIIFNVKYITIKISNNPNVSENFLHSRRCCYKTVIILHMKTYNILSIIFVKFNQFVCHFYKLKDHCRRPLQINL